MSSASTDNATRQIMPERAWSQGLSFHEMEDLLAKVERDMALAVREPEGDQPWGDSFQEMEELFTQVEHHTALAQIALDDIQMKLASIRSDAEPIPSHDAIPDNAVPGNVIRFRTR